MAHLKIFFYIFTLMIGIGAVVYAFLVKRAYDRPFLKPLLAFLVFNNLINLINLTSEYGCSNLLGFCKGYGYTVWPTILGPIARLSQFGILYAVAGIVQGFRGRRLSKPVRIGFAIGAGIVALSYVIFGVQAAQGHLIRWLFRGQRMVFDGGVYASLALLAYLLGISLRKPGTAESRAARAFASLYLAAYLVFVLTFQLPTETQFYPNAVMLLAVYVFPFFWFKRWFFAAFAGEGVRDIDDLALGKLCRDGDLTPRECELVSLILQGKSNAEIEKSLFISVHTVKNHLTNVFLKLGVKNRMQLIGRFQALQKGIRTDLNLVGPAPAKKGLEIRPN
jgi:DNA-binding CsgD family transcriptional regulator